ncbi:MAG: Ig-like domain-containing protein [Bacillota bacterium]|nr:Ig-like domain-containing protein [Bacillota bacterium]
MKRTFALVIAFIMALTIYTPLGEMVSYAEEQAPEGVSVQLHFTNAGERKTLRKNERFRLIAEAVPGSGTVDARKFRWKSGNRKVARVSSTGLVRARKKGKARITCYLAGSPEVKVSCLINVGPKVKSFAIDMPNHYLGIGESKTLPYTILPIKAANKIIDWSSSDTSVVAVSEDGKVTGSSEGEAVITGRTTDGTDLQQSLTFTVMDISEKVDGRFVAHRGLRSAAPENTIPSFRAAVNSGFDTIEFDVWESKTEPEEADPLLLVMHNKTTKTMCGKQNVVYSWELNRETIDDYRVINGSNAAMYEGGLAIPTAEEVLKVAFDAGVVPEIHIKDAAEYDISERAIDKILELVSGHEAIILTNETRVVEYIDNNGRPEGLRIWFRMGDVGPEGYYEKIEEIKELDIEGVTVSKEWIDTDVIAKAHETGFLVDTFDMGKPSELFYFTEMGADRFTCGRKLFTGGTPAETLAEYVYIEGVMPQIEIVKGESLQLVGKVMPETADQSVSWGVSDQNIADISADGMLDAIEYGTAYVYVSTLDGSGVMTKVKVRVIHTPISSIKLTNIKNRTLKLKKKRSFKVNCEVAPVDANPGDVRWRSSKARIARVLSDGTVIARKKGRAWITCYSVRDPKIKASFRVIVRK